MFSFSNHIDLVIYHHWNLYSWETLRSYSFPLQEYRYLSVRYLIQS